jgi:hypothetical protein
MSSCIACCIPEFGSAINSVELVPRPLEVLSPGDEVLIT